MLHTYGVEGCPTCGDCTYCNQTKYTVDLKSLYTPVEMEDFCDVKNGMNCQDWQLSPPRDWVGRRIDGKSIL